jgi:hypothetical protein
MYMHVLYNIAYSIHYSIRFDSIRFDSTVQHYYYCTMDRKSDSIVLYCTLYTVLHTYTVQHSVQYNTISPSYRILSIIAILDHTAVHSLSYAVLYYTILCYAMLYSIICIMYIQVQVQVQLQMQLHDTGRDVQAAAEVYAYIHYAILYCSTVQYDTTTTTII